MKLIGILVAMGFVTAGCSHVPTQPTDSTAAPGSSLTHEPPPPPPAPSTAEVHGGKNGKIHGTMIFTGEGSQIHVIGEFYGLKKNSTHGIHVHENGSCDGDKFSGAGGHLNPAHSQHGGPDSKIRHAGDLGNITADANGHAKLDVKIPSTPGVDTFGGRSVILHAKQDDEKSQPAGNSGDKIACGLIVQQK